MKDYGCGCLREILDVAASCGTRVYFFVRTGIKASMFISRPTQVKISASFYAVMSVPAKDGRVDDLLGHRDYLVRKVITNIFGV